MVQFTEDENSRTYLDFETINEGLDGVCQMYEQKLKASNPEKTEIEYDLQNLCQYIDELKDCAMLT